MKTFNLVLSGGGVRSYAHLGVYKYCFENGFKFNEIVAVSGGAIIAPFILLEKDPNELIDIFKKTRLDRLLFPFWFVPDKFEFLILEPSTYKLGKWIEKTIAEMQGLTSLQEIQSSGKLHIMATKNPLCGIEAMFVDMLGITDLKNAISATCAISGIFKPHQVGSCTYIDGAHWNSCPIFFDFKNSFSPVLAVSLGYPGLLEKEGGRFSKILRGIEINSYARVQEDKKRWEFEKSCDKRGDLFLVNPKVLNVRSLDFGLKDWQINEIINAGYKAAKETLSIKEAINV